MAPTAQSQFTDYTVYDNGAKLKIEQCENVSCQVIIKTILPDAAATAELNSLGNIVYGYNWGTKGKTNAPAAGIYKLTFTAKNTTIMSAPGAQNCAEGENCTYVIITVSPGGSGGGKPPGAVKVSKGAGAPNGTAPTRCNVVMASRGSSRRPSPACRRTKNKTTIRSSMRRRQ